MRIKTYLTLVCLYLCAMTTLNSQTQYIGPDGGAWFTPANWNNGLPASGNDALIGGGINVVIGSPLTIDFTITNFGGVTTNAPITNNGTISNSGTFDFSSTSGLINNGAFNNFASSTFDGPATFVNETGATFTNGGTFNLSTILTNKGLVTNNGTINAAAGTLLTQGSFDNSQTLTTESLTVAAGSTFTNNFGSNLIVTGAAALLQVDGNFNNLGNVEAGGTFNVTGNFSNSSLVLVASSLTISSGAIFNNAGGTVTNEGTSQNLGTFINGFQFVNKGSFTNSGIFNNNNLINNQLGATFMSGAGATIGMGFGSKIQNAGTFTTNGALDSFGNIENSNSFANGGTINSFSGSQINNLSGTFTNNGTISTNDKVNNNADFLNNGSINVNGGSVWKNNASFTNSTSGHVKNVQDFENLATLINNGRFTNLVRTLNEGSFTNNAYLENMGIFTNATIGVLTNKELFQQSAGTLLNLGNVSNASLFSSDDCSTISNDGAVNNNGILEVHSILFQRGTMSGAAVDCQGCYVHNAVDSDAPSICQDGTFGTDINGDVKVYAPALIAFENFDSCSNKVYLANGVARPVFTCSDIGTTINVNVVIRIPNTNDSLTCTAIITPKDELEPQFDNCPKDIVVFTDQAGVAVDWSEPSFLDNCTATDVVASHSPGDVFPIGIIGVTYTGTDVYGNVNNCQFRVDIRQAPQGGSCTGDGAGPSFVGCPNDISLVTTGGSANASWVAPTATDNCFPIFINTDFVPGQKFGVGTTAVVYTATDGNGNESTCSFNVTVNSEDPCAVDNTAPSFINCPANIYKPTNIVTGGAVAVWAAPNVFDLCGVASVTGSHSSGSVFPAGTTNVVYTAEDVNGNTANCKFTITVGNDPCPDISNPPVFSNCPSDISVQANGHSAVVLWTPPSANGACQPITINSNYAPGAVFQIGQTVVNYQASDVKGNTTTCSFRVTVSGNCTSDSAPPVISNCPSNITVPANNGSGVATWTAPTATDNCGLVSFSSTFLPGALFPVGVTTVIYSAGDLSGNGSTCQFNVSVVDAPGCITNAAPINLTTNVDPSSVNLSWNSSLNASAYDIYLGTTNPPTTLAKGNVAGTSTTVTGLQNGKTYYWYVVPKNAAGSATGCGSNATSFSTIGGGSDCLSDPKTVSVRVSSGNDDAEERVSSGSVSTGSSDLELGYDGSNKQIVGMRFRSIKIPNGATIKSAYIEFETDEKNSGTTNLVFTGEDTNDASSFSSSYHNISNRPKTTASVSWNNIPAWNTTSQKHKSPDLATIVQEIVDRNGWASGNDMVMMVEGSGERAAESYNGESSNAPLLVVEFVEQLLLPPTAVCKNATVQQSATGQTVTVNPQDVDGGSLANCGSITNRTVSPNSFNQPGVYPVTLTVTNSLGLTATCSTSVTVTGPPCSGKVTGLSFYNLNNGTSSPLTNGGTYYLSDLPNSYNIKASTSGTFESVNFAVSGAINDNHTENIEPYHYSGDANPLNLVAGNYTMVVTVYSQDQSSGNLCDQVTYHFTITDTPPCDPITLICESNINNNGWANHSDCKVTVCQGDKLILSVNPNGAQFSSISGPNGYNATSSGGNDFFISNSVNQSHAGDYYIDLVDGNGCPGSTVIKVVVEGAPMAVCKNITLQLQSIGQSVQINGQMIDSGSTGGCGTILTYNASPTSFSQPGTFPVKLTVTNSLGLSSSCDATVTVLAPEGGGGSNGPCAGNPGTGLLREIWYGVSEYNIANLTGKSSYPNNPDATYINASSKGPSSFGNNYGTRVRGFITPTVSGNYWFYVTGDDQTDLYLSTDSAPTNKSKIASVTGWTNENEFTKYGSQKSASIYLQSGKSYYVELLHIEIGGGDHWGIHWVKPGSSSPSAIPVQQLTPYDSGCSGSDSGNSILKTGKIVIEQANSSSWYWVNFDNPFSKTPVVILGPPSANSTEQVIPRLRNVTKTGFEFQIDEWDYLNGYHPTETLFYIAMEPGNHTINGQTIEAGSFTADHNWVTKSFNESFSSTPVVLTTVASYNDANAVAPRSQSVGKNSFQFKLQEENYSSHSNETINYIALKTGSFSHGGASFKAGITSNSVTDDWYTVDFGSSFSDPGFLASIHTFDGSDACALRHNDLTSTKVKIKVEEEQSQDWETSHPSEEIGWLVFSASTTLNFATSTEENLQLEAVKEEEHAILYWTHNEGHKIREYVLEKSVDGVLYTPIAMAESEGTNRPELYENYDLEPAVGENLYRVKLVHLDGTVTYSATASVFYADLIDFILFPNPANDFVKLNLEAIVGKEDVQVTIFNNLGVLVKEVNIDQVYSKYYQLDLREMKEGHYVIWLNVPERKPIAKQLVIGKM